MTESMISYIFLKIYNVAISKLDLMYKYCHALCCLNLIGQKTSDLFFWLHTGYNFCSTVDVNLSHANVQSCIIYGLLVCHGLYALHYMYLEAL